MTDRIEREMTLPAPAEDVWPAVTDPRELSDWFGADVELDARPGGRAVFTWPDGSQRGAVVEEVDEPHRFTFRWLPFERAPDGTITEVPPTRVEFELVPDGEDTLVRVVEAPAFSFVQARVSTLPARAFRPLASVRR